MTRFTLLRILVVCLLMNLQLMNAAAAQENQGPPVVKVAQPLVRTVTDWDVYTGRFQAKEEVVLQARVSGYLSSVNFDEGGLIEKGQLLFEIDDRPFVLAVQQAQAQVNSSNAALELAEVQNERAQELAARNVGTRVDADEARANLSQAQAQVALAEAQLATAELDLEFTRITAPISGRISAAEVDVGNLVVGGPAGATILGEIVSVDPIEFVFTVSEADFLKYARLFQDGSRPSGRTTDHPVGVRLMDEEGWPHQGQLTFVDNQLDPNSGTLLGRATLKNPNGFLQPGIFGRLRLPGSGEYQAVLIPDEATIADQSRTIVYVVDGENMVSEREVEKGPLHMGLRVIRSGLSEGETIIISGLQRARPGSPVSPQEEPLKLSDSES